MRLAYIDGNAGVSGNMLLGGLLGLGVPLDWLSNELRRLPLPLPEAQVRQVSQQGIAALHFAVCQSEPAPARHLSEILNAIEAAGFKPAVTASAKHCFELLAATEAKIHGVTPETIHFHEVGALDAIVDIVGSCLALDYLGIEAIVVSPIRVGFGTVKCAHGELPLPAPAASELLTGFKIFGGEYEGEWATPTGATILRGWGAVSGSMPLMEVLKIGYGAGSSQRAIPNILRVFLGEAESGQSFQDMAIILECNIDNMNPELYGYLGPQILTAGAKDYYFTPVVMKKGRPGILITVLAAPETALALENLLLTETTTLGVRRYQVERHCLKRDQVTVIVDGCEIRIKTAYHQGRLLKYSPEYEDAMRAAQTLRRPIREIFEAANFEARNILENRGAQ